MMLKKCFLHADRLYRYGAFNTVVKVNYVGSHLVVFEGIDQKLDPAHSYENSVRIDKFLQEASLFQHVGAGTGWRDSKYFFLVEVINLLTPVTPDTPTTRDAQNVFVQYRRRGQQPEILSDDNFYKGFISNEEFRILGKDLI